MKKHIIFLSFTFFSLFYYNCDNREFDDDNVITTFDYEFIVSENNITGNITGNKTEFKGFYDEKIPFILEIRNSHELKNQIYDIEYQILDEDPEQIQIDKENNILSGKFKSQKGQINLSLLAKSLGEKTLLLKCSNGNTAYDKQLRLKFDISTRSFEIVTKHIKSNDYLYPYPKKEYQSLGETEIKINSEANFSTMEYKLYIKPKVFGTKGIFLYNNKEINFNDPITPTPNMVLTFIPQSISKLEESQTISFQVTDKFGNVVEKTVDYKVKLDIDYKVNWNEDKGKVIPQYNIEGIGKKRIPNGGEKFQDRGNTNIVLNSKSNLSFYLQTTGDSNLNANLLFNDKAHPIKGIITLNEGTFQFVYVNRNTALQQESNFKFKNDITFSLGCEELDLSSISDKFTKKIEYKIYRVPTLILENSIRQEAKHTNNSSERYRKYFYSSHLKIQVDEEFDNGVNIIAVYGKGRAERFNNVEKFIGTKKTGVKKQNLYTFEISDFKFLYDPRQRRNSGLQATLNIDDDIFYYIEDYNGIKASYQGILKKGEEMDWGTEWKNYNTEDKGKGKSNLLFLL
jgi:hypothetical protein